MIENAYILFSTKKIWKSHELVKKNLVRAYLRSGSKLIKTKKIKIEDDTDLNKSLGLLIKRSHLSEQVIHIVVIDIGINLALLSVFVPFFNKHTVRFHLHLHGDLILRMEEWKMILNQLQGFRGSVRACSDDMIRLGHKILNQQPFIKMPFPIKDSFFSIKNTQKTKKEIYTYLGRITPDKRIVELLIWWKEFQTPSRELHLYGQWDEKRHLSWSTSEDFRHQMHEINLLMAASKNLVVKNLKNQAGLKKSIDQSSAIISFSTFMCEEYGLALREAAARGKALLLTDWGGHKDLASLPHCTFIKVEKKLNFKLPINFKAPRKLSSLHQKQRAFKEFSSSSIENLINKFWLQSGPFKKTPSKALSHEQAKEIVKSIFLS